jgi:hypothetical protein
MQSKRIKRAFFVPAILLIVPIIGELTVEGWNWSWHDYLFAYVIWTIFGLAYVQLTKNALTTKRKVAIGAAVFGLLAIIWVVLATG